MNTSGWAIAAFLIMGWVVLLNYLYETREAEEERAALAAREKAWLEMLLAARTRALNRVVRERNEDRELIVRAAQLERAGWEAYKLRAQGDRPTRPSAIITAAEETRNDRH